MVVMVAKVVVVSVVTMNINGSSCVLFKLGIVVDMVMMFLVFVFRGDVDHSGGGEKIESLHTWSFWKWYRGWYCE